MKSVQHAAVGRGAASYTRAAGLAQAAASRPRALPRAPVFDWLPPGRRGPAHMPCVADLPSTQLVTSGRAALAAALDQIDLTPGDDVLVPTYHCPTMVAPVLVRGLQPVLYAIGADGLPRLDLLDKLDLSRTKAIFVAHFFGLPRSLRSVRDWCDLRHIQLVEDCAHSFFGLAGERPVGAWGDLATASLSKFFPMREGGLLARAAGPLRPLAMEDPGLKRHLQSLADVLEFASHHDRPRGLAPLTKLLFAAKRRWRKPAQQGVDSDDITGPANAAQMMQACDMARIGEAPAVAVRWILHRQAMGPIVQRRQANFDRLRQGLASLDGASPLFDERPLACAPYVMPLRVHDPDRADRLYAALRQHGLPVFRWDRLWPDLVQPADDLGRLWSRQVLQLLCHQDLRQVDIDQVVEITRQAIRLA